MKLLAWKQKGDVILGYHVRDREVELEAVREAVRCFAAGEQPPRGYIPVPHRIEGAAPVEVVGDDATAYFKRRVFETYQALSAAFKGATPRRRAVATRKAVSP